MSMLDDLLAMPTSSKPCVFQRILQDEGQERYDEVMEVIQADDSAPRKLKVLVDHKCEVTLWLVKTHVRGECRQCR